MLSLPQMLFEAKIVCNVPPRGLSLWLIRLITECCDVTQYGATVTFLQTHCPPVDTHSSLREQTERYLHDTEVKATPSKQTYIWPHKCSLKFAPLNINRI